MNFLMFRLEYISFHLSDHYFFSSSPMASVWSAWVSSATGAWSTTLVSVTVGGACPDGFSSCCYASSDPSSSDPSSSDPSSSDPSSSSS